VLSVLLQNGYVHESLLLVNILGLINRKAETCLKSPFKKDQSVKSKITISSPTHHFLISYIQVLPLSIFKLLNIALVIAYV
jgi:hypothetical protein